MPRGIRYRAVTQDALRRSVWNESEINWEAEGNMTIQLISRGRRAGRRKAAGARMPSVWEWEHWVVVAPSAILRGVAPEALGLYACRTFHEGDYVGYYDGTVLGTFTSRAEAMGSNVARRTVRSVRGDKLITRNRSSGGGVELVDGSSQGPPYMSRINDPRGTPYRSTNVTLTSGGWIRATKSIQAFNPAKSLAENAKSELRFDYGDEYWALRNLLGTGELPILVDE